MLNIQLLMQYFFVWGTNPRFKNPYTGAVKLLLMAAFDFPSITEFLASNYQTSEIFVLLFPKFLACASKKLRKNSRKTKKTTWKISLDLKSVGTNPRFKNPYAGAVKLLLLAAFDFEVVCILD